MEVAGTLGAPLGLAQRKRASPRWEAAADPAHCFAASEKTLFQLSGRFAHSLHTAARLPGQLYHLSEAEPPSKATFPQCFQLGWGLPVLRVEGQRQNTHIGPCLGVHIIEERGQQPHH